MVVGHGAHIHSAESLPVGAVTLSHRRLRAAPVSGAVLAGLRHDIRAALQQTPAMGKGDWDRAIATSGSAQRIARIINVRRGKTERASVDGLEVGREDLAWLCRRLAEASSHHARVAIPGMDPERADVLLGGVLIFEELSAALNVERWVVSMAGLRMGLVAEALRQRKESS